MIIQLSKSSFVKDITKYDATVGYKMAILFKHMKKFSMYVCRQNER